jgi:hypothetical protein
MTLIAHGTEGSIFGRDLWSGDDGTRYAVVYLVTWSLVAIGLLLADRAFWRVRDDAAAPAPGAVTEPAGAPVSSAAAR